MTTEAEIHGSLFLMFRAPCQNLKIALGPQFDEMLDGLALDQWYPLTRYQRLWALLAEMYPTPGPVFERIGAEGVRLWFEQYGKPHTRGLEFLHSLISPDNYRNLVRGDAAAIGGYELISLSETDGTAVLKSNSIYQRDVERGFIYGGMLGIGDLGYVTVETDHDLHRIEFH